MALTPGMLFCEEDAKDFDDDDANNKEAAEQTIGIRDRQIVKALMDTETEHMPLPDYLARIQSSDIDDGARRKAVKWILKVNEFYKFRPVTVYLAVNYLDRFLSSHTLPECGDVGGGWALQLLSVACVSVAAKMEETCVPFVVDLQNFYPLFVFEPRTVKRMELLLMSALRWRMRSVSPFDFIEQIEGGQTDQILLRAAKIVVDSLNVVEFLVYRPSTLAAAALLCAADEIAKFGAVDARWLYSSLVEWTNMVAILAEQEALNGCRQLIDEYLVDTCPPARSSKPSRTVKPAPKSPTGVLDAAACQSCDSNSSAATVGSEPRSSKRRRLEAKCTENIGSIDASASCLDEDKNVV